MKDGIDGSAAAFDGTTTQAAPQTKVAGDGAEGVVAIPAETASVMLSFSLFVYFMFHFALNFPFYLPQKVWFDREIQTQPRGMPHSK